jgi:hypothetical protein
VGGVFDPRCRYFMIVHEQQPAVARCLRSGLRRRTYTEDRPIHLSQRALYFRRQFFTRISTGPGSLRVYPRMRLVENGSPGPARGRSTSSAFRCGTRNSSRAVACTPPRRGWGRDNGSQPGSASGAAGSSRRGPAGYGSPIASGTAPFAFSTPPPQRKPAGRRRRRRAFSQSTQSFTAQVARK